jgi:glucose/arabinose dehydrogenase
MSPAPRLWQRPVQYLTTGTTRIVVLVLFGSGIGTPSIGQTLPVGFVDEAVVGGLNLPTAFTILPDGRLLVAEKDGLVRVISGGQLLPAPFIDLRSSVNDYWDHGLLGIAADLNFASNGFVYLLYTYENDPTDYTGPKTGRLTRVTASGNVASPASAFTVLGTTVGSSCNDFPIGTDCIPTDSSSHSIGNIKVAPDGTLFVTTGDGASWNVVDDDALRSQNLDSLSGKMLHITPLGKGVPGNPFWNGNLNANRSKVWAYGLRNAYRFALDPVSGVPFFGDAGWASWEEINAANPATGNVNFGWPCYEGPYRQGGYEPKATCQALYALEPNPVQAPAVAYSNNGAGAAVTGGVFYTGTSFPALYHGVFFYADYALGFVRYFRVNGAGAKTGPVYGFGVGLSGPVYFDTDGDLLYVSITTGEIRRIRYTGASPDVSYLSDRQWTAMSNGWGPVERDQSNGEDSLEDGLILSLNNQAYPKGLGAHAPSDVRFALNGSCTVFAAAVGVDDESFGAVVFQVFADGVKIFDSGLMNASSVTQMVNVNVSGRTELRLVVADGGDGISGDHADWADARVTCPPADTVPPTVSSVSPPEGATGVTVFANTTASFSEAMTASTLSASTVTVVPQGSPTPVAATVTYAAATNTVTLDPAADLAAGTLYTATIKGGAAGVKDLAGNPLASDRVWTFTTGATGTVYLSDLTWTSMSNGWGPVERDRSNGELGASDGAPIRLNGVTYAKGLGAHAASEVRYAVNGACSVLTASVGVDDEVGAAGSIVFQVWTDGVKQYDSGVMTGATATASVNVNLAGVTELALVMTDGGNGNGADHGDWANAQVSCGADTTAPTVPTVSPVAGASGVVVTSHVTGTFSEAMAVATLTTTTVTLAAQGSPTPVAATVSYDALSRTVTLDPTANLATSTMYTATIKGGAAGAKDLAGNPLAVDRVWTFTTAATGATTSYLSDRTWTSMSNGWGPVERDRSNGESGATDGGPLRLNGVTYAKGLGAHAASDVRYALNGTCSVLTAVVGLDDEVGSWGSAVFQVWTDGVKRYDSGVMTGVMPGLSISVSLAGATELALIFIDSGDGLGGDHGNWADAQVSCSTDTTAPTVTTVSPVAGATGVAVGANVTGTFSEAMNAATLTTTTVTLAPQGSPTPVAATVTYAAATGVVTLDPTPALAANTLYTATIKGGASGVKDVAGNAMAADRVWSFRTQ